MFAPRPSPRPRGTRPFLTRQVERPYQNRSCRSSGSLAKLEASSGSLLFEWRLTRTSCPARPTPTQALSFSSPSCRASFLLRRVVYAGVIAIPEATTREPAQELHQEGANDDRRAREPEPYEVADSW